MKFRLSLLYFVLSQLTVFAQADTLRVLFLGNSYTQAYNLPQMVASLSAASGTPMITDSNLPGGFTLSGHAADATSLTKIRQGNWDYVVLQEQSQVPTVDYYRYNLMYPGAQELHDSIALYNPCATLVTFMTWGRRFGGQQCLGSDCSPVFIDFNHMQDSLRSAYEEVADLIGARCAPVGIAWKNVLADTSLVLHSSDNSHPGQEGSYLAACVIYSSISHAASSGLSYTGGLPPSTGLYLQQQADLTVFNSASDWNLFIDQPIADFNYSITGNDVYFTDLSTGMSGMTHQWDFGDGNTATGISSPQHTYVTGGNYTVTLIVERCGQQDTASYVITISPSSIDELKEKELFIYPVPCEDWLSIQLPENYTDNYFRIMDIHGKVIQSGMLSKNFEKIRVTELLSGIYFLEIENRRARFIRR